MASARSPRSPRGPSGPHIALMFKLLKFNSGSKYTNSSDIFVDIVCPGVINEDEKVEKIRSKPSKKGAWDEAFYMYIEEKETRPLTIEVWKKSSLGKDTLVGTGQVNYLQLESLKYHNSLPIAITKSKHGKSKAKGEIAVTVKYEKIKKVDAKKAEQQAQELMGDLSISLGSSDHSVPDPSKVEAKHFVLSVSSVGFEEELSLKFTKVSVNDVYCLSLFFKSGEKEVELILPTSMRQGGEFKQGPIVRMLFRNLGTELQNFHLLKVDITEEGERLDGKVEGKTISVQHKKLFFVKGYFKVNKKDILKGIQADVPNFHDQPYEVQGNLCDAVHGKDAAKIKEYLDKFYDINVTNNSGDTPLHLAIIYNLPLELVELLIENGANPLLKNKAGDSAVDLAKKISRTEVLDLLNKYYL